MKTRTSLVWVSLGLGLLAWGCEKGDTTSGDTSGSVTPSPSPDPSQTPSPAPSPTPSPAKDETANPAPSTPPAPGAVGSSESLAPVVTLLKPGSGTRRELRFAPKKGQKEIMDMVMRMDLEMTMNGASQPRVKLPAMTMSMSVDIEDVNASGDIAYRFELTDAKVKDEPGVMPQVITAMRTALSSTVGTKGHATVTSRGVAKSAKVEVPPSVAPDVRQMMQSMERSMGQMSAPVPVEPVGLGATWKVLTHLDQNGIKLDQTATYVVTAIDAEGFSADVSVEQSAKEQTIPGGKLTKLVSSGKGKVKLRLSNVVPAKSEIGLSTEVHMQAMGGAVVTKVKLDVQMAPH